MANELRKARGMDTDEFIHHENLAMFRKKLADPTISEDQGRVIERLLVEEEAKEARFNGENGTTGK